MIWKEECIPAEWKKSAITSFYKEKGDIQGCGNYKGIKLMLHKMKIWGRISLTRDYKRGPPLEKVSLDSCLEGLQQMPILRLGSKVGSVEVHV